MSKFSSIFQQGGLVWRILNTMTDVVFLSVLWCLCSMPVVTLGAATTALYDSVIHCIRYKEEGPYRRFFRTFKSDLKTTIFTTLLWGIGIAVCLILLKYLRDTSVFRESAAVAAAAYYVVLLIPIGAFVWAFPTLSRFSNTFSSLNATALKLSFAQLPRTLILVLLTIEILEFCLQYIFPLLFMPSLMVLLWSLFIEPVFQKAGGGLKKELTDKRKDSLVDSPEEIPEENFTTEQSDSQE